jgi:TolB-like protein
LKLFGEGGLFAKLKERRFAQFLGVYFAAAWGALQVLDQLTNRGVLPGLLYQVALTLTICGFPAVLIVTWFHGKRGDQQMPPAEKILIAVVTIFALTVSGFVVRAGLDPNAAGARGVALEEYEDPTRVAVLYFEPRGGEEAEFIARGLTEGLINELTLVDTLHVISSNGSQQVEGASLSDMEIARTLGAGTLVRGTVSVAGEQVRVEVRMIEGGEGAQLASEQIDGPRANIFELQDSLSAQVAVFLREIIGQEVERVEAQSGTDVVEAWELVQRADKTAADAQALIDQGQQHAASDQFGEADQLLVKAAALDPEWPLPLSRRGWYEYRFARSYGLQALPQREPLQRALAYADSALAREPQDPDALELRGTVNYWRSLINLVEHDDQHAVVDAAENDLRVSAERNRRPASAYASLSHLLLNGGDVAGSKLFAQRSYEADPFLSNANLTLWRLANTSWELGTTTEAVRWCEEGAKRFEHDFRFAQCRLMLFGLRDYPTSDASVDSAWAAMRQMVELAPPPVRPLWEKQGILYVAWALVRANLPDSAEAIAARGRAGPDIDPVRQVAYSEAILRLWLAQLYRERAQEPRAQEQMRLAIRQLGDYLAANPSSMEGFRTDATNGRIDKWYLEGLVNEPGFRQLVGVP